MDKNKIIARVVDKLAQDVEKHLKNHDWRYPFSDSQGIGSNGNRTEEMILRKLSKMNLDEAICLWNKHAPKNAQKDKRSMEKLLKKYKLRCSVNLQDTE